MVNEQGYYRPTYDELLADRITQAQELFGEDIDTSNASPLGKFIRLAVQDLADAYEAQEIIYYSRFPHTATGQNLDRLMPFAGITRNPATRARHSIKFVGTANATIENGFLVGTTGDEEFYLVNDLTLDSSGEGTGTVECTEFGEIGNVALGAISEIINPDVNVESITHVAVEELGEETESDESLRKRFGESISGAGASTSSSIQGSIMRVSGVRDCIIEENDSNQTDSGGRPAHSFEVFVYAPSSVDQDIAEAIFEKKPIGIKTHGDISKTVIDASGKTHTVYFSRITDKTVYIKMSIKTDARFELDGIEQIKAALIGYIDGLGAGDDVIYTTLYRYIYGVAGVTEVTELTLSTNGTSYSAANVSIDSAEIASLSAANIEVTKT